MAAPANSMLKSSSSDSSSLPSSGDSLSRAAATHAYHMNRNFMKLAVDAGYLVGYFSNGKKEVVPLEKGVKSDQIKAGTGNDDVYDDLCADPELTLVRINYCQTALSDPLQQKLLKLPKERFEEMLTTDSRSTTNLSHSTFENTQKVLKRSVLNHDYLVLELRPRADAEHGIEKFYILAEKVASGGIRDNPGIYIWYHTAEEAEKFLLHAQTKLLDVEIGTKMSLQTIVENLKKEDADYSLRDANCWDYAVATTKHLIDEAAGVPGTSEAAKDRLMKERNNLISNLTTKNLKNISVTLKDKLLSILAMSVVASQS